MVESDGIIMSTEGVVSESLVDRAVVNTVKSDVSRGVLVGSMAVAVGVLVVDRAISLTVGSANNLKR